MRGNITQTKSPFSCHETEQRQGGDAGDEGQPGGVLGSSVPASAPSRTDLYLLAEDFVPLLTSEDG